MKNQNYLWHPNTQMLEWTKFPKIVRGEGMWLIDDDGNKLLDGVASMWCNVWGHSKKELINAIIKQTKKLQHSPLFNLTNEPAEMLAEKLIKMSPNMAKVFFSDNGSTAMEIAIKIALQYWDNLELKNKTKIATLENGYHGDTFGAMSVGYVPEFFSKFRSKLFSTLQFKVPRQYHLPRNITLKEFENICLEKIENKLSKDDTIAAFVMESGAQVAGGVNIYPKNFQKRINAICKKYNVLFVLDEIATGFGRLGSMIEYKNQDCHPDIVSFGKMLTGGYLTFAATLTTRKISNSFLGKFSEGKHLFHGHTYTGNPIAASLSLENIKLYEKTKLIQKIQKTSKVFENRVNEFYELEQVGDVRQKGMLMGVELLINNNSIKTKKSINKIVFDEGKKHNMFFRTLGNVVMLVPPLAISNKEINLLVDGALKTIKGISKSLK
ncbi:adenosylmethionine--8-amino-7-oxononanoate transaminase [Marine Group I thaumarchaeote]|uniref:Adenosylmethionine-8-amino-7-oxononanoate aminotransferase n=1 Tax=Marine Group I thaumarchaeote TaxID=2511932 RepID=A0A7K4NLT1_9ARCH|nr:adenosylmethionine--8-amino-7-oxononanoate transaminase [Marine Group I thaumarchaeote]